MRTPVQAFPQSGNTEGFTLLELLLVVTILSAMAWMSLSVVNNNGDQVRFEDTRNRLRAIRRAIIGDTSRTVNGGPEISGYVADMGGPPADLNALLAREYCSGQPDMTASSACATAGGTWISQPAYDYDAVHQLWTGWNGPYLPAAELSGYPRFQDGWGRNDVSNNFGWRYSPSAAGLTIQSYGRDWSGGGGDMYDDDYPPASSQPYIQANGYQVTLTTEGTAAPNDGTGGLLVDFGTPPPCWICSVDPATYKNRKVCEASGHVWTPVYTGTTQATCTGDAVWLPTVSPTVVEDICLSVARRTTGSVAEIHSKLATFTWNGSRQVLQFKFEDGATVGQGQSSYAVVETSGSACTATPFPKAASQWRVFSILPGAVLQPLAWEVR